MTPGSATRAFLLGAVFDFMSHCYSRENPMVVGGAYPRDKIIDEFEAWAKRRGLGLEKIDTENFRIACEIGALK